MGIVIRQSIKGTIINYIGAFIGFITTMYVVTKFLKPEEVGLTKVICEVALLFSGFAQLGTSASAMRFFPYFKNPEKKNNGFFFYLMVLPCIGGTLFITLYFLLKEPVSLFFGENAPLFVNYYDWVAPLIIFFLFWGVFETYSNLLLRIVIPKCIREVFVRLLLLGVYLLYVFNCLNLDGLVIGTVSVYGIAMLLTFFYISRIGTISLKHDFSYIDRPLRQRFLRYTLFLILGAIGGNIIGQLDTFMVSGMMGLNYTGIYTVAWYMATVIEIPMRSITSISSPLAATALKERDIETINRLYKKVSLHQLIAGSAIILLIWINIDNIFKIIPNGAVYSEGKWVVFFIGIAKLISVTLNFGGVLISFSRYYYWTLCFTFLLTVLTICTNYLLIPKFGMTGAAIATFTTCLVSYSFQQWIVLRKIKGNPYSLGTLKVILIAVIIFVLNMFCPQLENPWFDGIYRTLLAVTIGILLLYKLRVSEEINGLISRFLTKIGRK